ncbi:MAG: S-layer domain-containing protein, partial [Candidatus Hecatellales archaeon B24]
MLPAAQAQSVSLNVVRVYWGSDGSLQPKPGDKNVPLNVIVQNTDTSTINHLMARLKLHGTPFTSSTGALEAYAGASAILPGGTATLSFRLNIAEEAALKDYTLPLEFTVLTSKYASGVDVSLHVSIPLYGEVRFSASLEPWEVPPGVKEVKLKIENFGEAEASDVRINVSPVSPLTLAEGDGLYTLSRIAPSTTETLDLKLYIPSSLEGNVGTVNVSISYQDAYGSQRSESKSLSLKVSNLKEWFNVTVSPETIRPEENTVTFTLSNQGDGTAEDVEVKLTLPQTLSLLKSDNVWKFSSVAPGEEVSFETEIYAST